MFNLVDLFQIALEGSLLICIWFIGESKSECDPSDCEALGDVTMVELSQDFSDGRYDSFRLEGSDWD